MCQVKVLFRVDAGQEIGSGHFMRCRILAHALREREVQTGFITSTADNPFIAEAKTEKYPVVTLPKEKAEDAETLIQAVQDRNLECKLIVVDDHRDGFHSVGFQNTVRQAGVKLMMISFRHDCHFVADVVHNQNLLALERDYSADNHTDLLLGPRYAVLKQDFQDLQTEDVSVPERARTVLVTFGGADYTNQTRKVVAALGKADLTLEKVTVVVGGMYPNPAKLDSYLNTLTDLGTELHVNTPNMPKLMAASDLAISSGGLTAWELACLGVPNMILSTADAERETGQLLHEREAAYFIGHQSEVTTGNIIRDVTRLVKDQHYRQQLSITSREMVDGYGTTRVADCIESIISK